jgi:Domain of unknown function (DUF4175)
MMPAMTYGLGARIGGMMIGLALLGSPPTRAQEAGGRVLDAIEVTATKPPEESASIAPSIHLLSITRAEFGSSVVRIRMQVAGLTGMVTAQLILSLGGVKAPVALPPFDATQTDREGAVLLFVELGDQRWVGERVKARIELAHGGQRLRTNAQAVLLMPRAFLNSRSQNLAELRSSLLSRAITAREAVNAIEAFVETPADHEYDFGVYLGLRLAQRRLDAKDLTGAAALLWAASLDLDGHNRLSLDRYRAEADAW